MEEQDKRQTARIRFEALVQRPIGSTVIVPEGVEPQDRVSVVR
jgi:hypothetical protein